MNDTAAAVSERQKQIEARRARVNALIPRRERVRVMPRDDEVRKFIKHPETGTKFPASGSVEWPLDRFTKRRLRDGTVTLAEQDQHHESHRRARRTEE